MIQHLGDLNRIATMHVPGNPGNFVVDQFVRPGAPRILGVGGKLASEIENFSILNASAGTIGFYLAHESEAANIPGPLQHKFAELSWWQLYFCLQWPNQEVLRMLDDVSQIGCLVGCRFEERAVRIKLGWETGHNLGGRPSEPNWTWDAGTVFAAVEPS